MKAVIARKSYVLHVARELKKRKNEDFLLQKLSQEWSEIEKSRKRKEFFDKTRETGAKIGKALLFLSLIAGGLLVVLVAPNIVSVSDHFGRHRFYFKKDKFSVELARLKSRKFVVTGYNKGGREIQNTRLGTYRAFRMAFLDYKIEKPPVWDGSWRIVVFDIPNKYSKMRDRFRFYLRRLGFYQFQKSIFIFPYECKKDINFFSDIFDIREFVFICEVKQFSGDEVFKKFFRLS